jgi:hypothetical protein
VSLALAAVECDGVDDSLGGIALSNYVTAATKTVVLRYTSTGTSPAAGSCGNVAVQALVAHTGGISRLNIVRRTSTELCTNHHDGTVDQMQSPYVEGTPIHIAMTHTGGGMVLYADGVAVDTVASGDLSTLTPLLSICGNTGVFAAGQGIIDYVATYDVAVPADEIAALAVSRRPRLRRTIPTGEWLFDNCTPGSGTDAVVFRDHSGNSRTLTGSDGANNTGLTCQASTVLGMHGGIQ